MVWYFSQQVFLRASPGKWSDQVLDCEIFLLQNVWTACYCLFAGNFVTFKSGCKLHGTNLFWGQKGKEADRGQGSWAVEEERSMGSAEGRVYTHSHAFIIKFWWDSQPLKIKFPRFRPLSCVCACVVPFRMMEVCMWLEGVLCVWVVTGEKMPSQFILMPLLSSHGPVSALDLICIYQGTE